VISILIPACNEADRLGETLRALDAALQEAAITDREILVIDDGSTDATAEVARAAGCAGVLSLQPNRGKGGALNAGLVQTRGEVILTLDADLGASAAEAPKLLAPVLAGEAEMSIALFPSAGKSGGFGAVVKLARWAIFRATGEKVAAPLSGQRAIRRELLEAVDGFAEGFSVETALTLDALRRGFRVVSVPTQMQHRALGRTLRGFLHRAKQFAHVARVVWQKRAWVRDRSQTGMKGIKGME
jgi:glycosyltransferase involved in cell wall biosynthesis